MSEIDFMSMIQPASHFVAKKGKIACIMGQAGIGKTTAAATLFPSPLFIPIEQGMMSVQATHSLPRPAQSGNVLWYLDEAKKKVLAGEFPYKTIVLDSVSELDTMIIRELVQAAGVSGINDGELGYGKGYAAAAETHRGIKEQCNELSEMGIHIVAIAHIDIKSIDEPDRDAYSKFVLQMSKGGANQWTNQTDMNIHIREAVSMVENKSKTKFLAQAIKGKRVLDMVPKPSTIAKNRFSITKEIDWVMPEDGTPGVNPLAFLFEQPQGAAS